MEKQFIIQLSEKDMDTLSTIFDIVFRAKGLEAGNPSMPISLLLKKIQDTAVEIPVNTSDTIYNQTNTTDENIS